MSADILRQAADRFRESVELAASQPEISADVRGVWLNARYYPVLSTPAALAVADWLDCVVGDAKDGIFDQYEDALPIARAYLGESA